MKLKFSLLSISLVSLLFLSCQPEKDVYLFSFFQNNGADGLHLAYSYDGYHFEALNNNESLLTPTVSEDKLMRDPCIIQGKDGLFHMVWTVSWNDKGIGYANSADLINWSEQEFIPVMADESEARNCWAPEIFYDDETEDYIIYWATTVTGRFPVSDSCCESNYNHRMYYVTTKDFKEFSDTELLYDNDFSIIDAVIKKYNGTYYMFLKDETKFPAPEKNIRIATSQHATHGWSTPSEPITMDNVWVEGPTIINIGEEYLVYFDMYRDHRMGAVRSADLKNWENISDSISFPAGTRHGTIFKTDEKVLGKLMAL